MIALQYGMQGSASSWVFGILRTIAEHQGSPQHALLDRAQVGPRAWRRLKGARLDGCNEPSDAFDLVKIAQLVPDDAIIVLKTHSSMPDYALQLLLESKMKVFATIRDPVDAAWSVYNKGIRARKAGKREFSSINNINQAFHTVDLDLRKAATWMHKRNVYLFPFDLIRSEPAACIRIIGRELGCSLSDEQVCEIADSVPSNFFRGIRGQGHDNIDPADISKFYS